MGILLGVHRRVGARLPGNIRNHGAIKAQPSFCNQPGRVPIFSTEQRVVRQVWSGCSVQYGTRSHGRHGQHSTPGKPSIEYAGVFDPNEERAVSVNVWQAWGVRTGPLGWRVRAFLRDMLSHLLHVHTYCFHAFLRDMPRSIICVRPRLLCTFSTWQPRTAAAVGTRDSAASCPIKSATQSATQSSDQSTHAAGSERGPQSELDDDFT